MTLNHNQPTSVCILSEHIERTYLLSLSRHSTRIGRIPDEMRSSIGGFLSLDSSFLITSIDHYIHVKFKYYVTVAWLLSAKKKLHVNSIFTYLLLWSYKWEGITVLFSICRFLQWMKHILMIFFLFFSAWKMKLKNILQVKQKMPSYMIPKIICIALQLIKSSGKLIGFQISTFTSFFYIYIFYSITHFPESGAKEHGFSTLQPVLH